jgi:signal transduction histidine kinase
MRRECRWSRSAAMTSGTCAGPRRTYARYVSDEGLDRLGAWAGLLGWAAVSLPVLLGDPAAAPGPLWWLSYLANGALFALTSTPAVSRRRRLVLGLLAAQVAAGLTTFVLDPGYGFSAVLLVVNAASAAFLLPLRATLWLVAAQAVVATAMGISRAGTDEVAPEITEGLVYGGLQLFAVLMVETGLREARAREALAVANRELAEAQAQLAESSRATERLRIARELHDLVGHQLTALAVNLEVASHLADGPAGVHVDRSRALAKGLLGDVREVVSQLRDPFDLATALRTLGSAVPQPQMHLELDPQLAVADPRHAQALLRCVQEIVTNTVRHADARNLWVEVTNVGGETVVRARDDGRGSDPVCPGNGLTGMTERLAELGGRVSYRSGPQQGFSIVATLPAP